MDDKIRNTQAGITTVVCGLLKNKAGLIFAAQRGSSQNEAGYWEFPGGKVEAGESLHAALARELLEELNLRVRVGRYLAETTFSRNSKNFRLVAFSASAEANQKLKLSEHAQAGWFSYSQLQSLNLLPADVVLLQKIRC